MICTNGMSRQLIFFGGLKTILIHCSEITFCLQHHSVVFIIKVIKHNFFNENLLMQRGTFHVFSKGSNVTYILGSFYITIPKVVCFHLKADCMSQI